MMKIVLLIQKGKDYEDKYDQDSDDNYQVYKDQFRFVVIFVILFVYK